MPPGIHHKVSKGRHYYYFRTGAVVNGKPVMKPMPDINSIEFGPAYANALRLKGRRQTPRNVLTVRAMADMFEVSPQFAKHAESTRRSYSRALRTLSEEIGEAPAEEVERKDIVALIDKKAATPGTANMLLSVAGALYTWGRERGHVTVRPTSDIPYFDSEDYEPWPHELVEAALADDDPFIRRSVALLYYTAQRVGDIARLKWANLADGRVRLKQQKRGVEVDFPVHADLVPHLGRPEGIFVLTVDGKPIAPEAIRKRLQPWAAKRGYKVVPHGLRKNAINALLEAGCSVPETAAVSGQTMRYVEHYGKKRSRGKLGGAAIIRWQNGSRT